MTEGMVFFREYFDYLDDLTPEEFVELMKMIRDLRYNDKDTPVEEVEDRMVRLAWRAVRPSVLKSARNAKDYQNKKEKKKKKAKSNTTPATPKLVEKINKVQQENRSYEDWLREESKKKEENMTASEKRVAKWMDEHNILYIPQWPIVCFPKIGYIVDFYLSRHRAIIEVDGETHNSDEARERDALRTKHLESKGYKVYRIENRHTSKEYINSKMLEIMGRIEKECIDLEKDVVSVNALKSAS